MVLVTLHYKDPNGVVNGTVVRVLPDSQVNRYVHYYRRNDRVVVRTRMATPGDLRRDRRRAARVARHLGAA